MHATWQRVKMHIGGGKAAALAVTAVAFRLVHACRLLMLTPPGGAEGSAACLHVWHTSQREGGGGQEVGGVQEEQRKEGSKLLATVMRSTSKV